MIGDDSLYKVALGLWVSRLRMNVYKARGKHFPAKSAFAHARKIKSSVEENKFDPRGGTII